MQDNNKDDYEKICFVGRRPESVTGKQVIMPGGMNICNDCMQRTIDAIDRSGASGMNPADLMNFMNEVSTPNNTPSNNHAEDNSENQDDD